MKKTFNSYSFGCRVNHAEREQIDIQMTKKGFKHVKEDPDFFIINTCSVTHNAERSARQLIYQTRRNNPKTKIVVTGCSATYWLKNGLYKDIPADLFIDNVNKEFLVALLEKKFNKMPQKIKRQDDKYISPIVDKFQSSDRIVIKIQDGCHRFCTFCIVPYLRGLPKSKKINEIIKIIKSDKEPLKEVILTAINTEAFGKDTGESFTDLIKEILSQTAVPRISFGSIHPWSITDEFLEFYLRPEIQKRLVHFFHIPLQSGSNKMLQLMRRVHTREDMLNRVNNIASVNPYAFIATDVIVGFLDETDDDFQDTYNFLAESPISKFHVFRFSKRIQTAAYFMAKRLSEPTDLKKKERALLLRELSDKKYQNFLTSLIGYTSETLILKEKKGKFTKALLNNQIPVLIKGRILNRNLPMCKAIELEEGELIAEVVG